MYNQANWETWTVPGQQLTQREQGNRQGWDGFEVAADSHHDTKPQVEYIKNRRTGTTIDMQGKKHAVASLLAANN